MQCVQASIESKSSSNLLDDANIAHMLTQEAHCSMRAGVSLAKSVCSCDKTHLPSHSQAPLYGSFKFRSGLIFRPT